MVDYARTFIYHSYQSASAVPTIRAMIEWCKFNIGNVDENWEFNWAWDGEDDRVMFRFANQEDFVRFQLTHG